MTDYEPLQDRPVRLCSLCGRPIVAGSIVQYMGQFGRDFWCHAQCWQERYHPRPKEEPKEKQAAMFGEQEEEA